VQIGPVWRAERPQKGRYRQFTQCDIDILGVASEIAEIELILATTEALGALGLEGLTVRINDRRLLGAMASWCGFAQERHTSVFITLDKWDKLAPAEIRQELDQAIARAVASGVSRDAIIIDPGLGFAKRAEHSFVALASLDALRPLDRPILCGPSRKSFLTSAIGKKDSAIEEAQAKKDREAREREAAHREELEAVRAEGKAAGEKTEEELRTLRGYVSELRARLGDRERELRERSAQMRDELAERTAELLRENRRLEAQLRESGAEPPQNGGRIAGIPAERSAP